jgi:hypothetical protein
MGQSNRDVSRPSLAMPYALFTGLAEMIALVPFYGALLRPQ